MDTFEITPEPRRPIPLCSVCIKSDFETEEILVSSKGCPTCGMVLKGLSLVTNITDVTRIILDFDKEMFVSCWHQNGDVIWYEFYVSETGIISLLEYKKSKANASQTRKGSLGLSLLAMCLYQF